MNYQDPAVQAQIIADDPGGDFVAAHAVVAAMTVSQLRTMNANELTIWAAMYAVIPAMEADVSVTQGISKAALTLLGRSTGTLDLGDSDVQTMLTSLVGTGVLVQAAVDDLNARATETVAKYPNISQGDLLRARGEEA